MKSITSLKDITYPRQLITWSSYVPTQDKNRNSSSLVMVWEKEYKGDRAYLIAKWVLEE